jgi:hypothetical protein
MIYLSLINAIRVIVGAILARAIAVRMCMGQIRPIVNSLGRLGFLWMIMRFGVYIEVADCFFLLYFVEIYLYLMSED